MDVLTFELEDLLLMEGENMKLLTGFAVVKDNVGNRIAYTTSEVDEAGIRVSSNNKESFVVLDPETNNLIEQLEEKIKERLK